MADDDIRIDIGRYFARHGRKPAGRGYWVFRIVSPLATAKDHELRMPEEMAFKSRARGPCRLRRGASRRGSSCCRTSCGPFTGR
jgi:hypothetical protein